MKALLFERSLPRFAAARAVSTLTGRSAPKMSPLRVADVAEPRLPAPGWHRVRPRLAGICGSDLATLNGRSSRWFEPIVSFPFVPGHEVVGELDDGTRVVLEPVLACAARGIDPPCPSCAAGENGNCERISFGHVKPGLQTGFCKDTGGGWGLALVAHESQLHLVPDDLSDEAAVMVEPTACAVHAVESAGIAAGDTVAVIGAGTLGLCTVAALATLASPSNVIVAAKHPEQQRLARSLGADVVVQPDELPRAVRRATRSLNVGGSDVSDSGARLTGGADVTIDCVGSADSVAQALAITRPRGRVSLVGMPGTIRVDLTPLWHREIALVGAYAYRHTTFATAFDLVRTAQLDRLVSAVYPLDRFAEAVEHAGAAGARGGVKIAFDLRQERRR
jgi:threonine dehydrogenase-like Zn-dependent dehydrogenase